MLTTCARLRGGLASCSGSDVGLGWGGLCLLTKVIPLTSPTLLCSFCFHSIHVGWALRQVRYVPAARCVVRFRSQNKTQRSHTLTLSTHNRLHARVMQVQLARVPCVVVTRAGHTQALTRMPCMAHVRTRIYTEATTETQRERQRMNMHVCLQHVLLPACSSTPPLPGAKRAREEVDATTRLKF